MALRALRSLCLLGVAAAAAAAAASSPVAAKRAAAAARADAGAGAVAGSAAAAALPTAALGAAVPLAFGNPVFGAVATCNNTIWTCPALYSFAAPAGTGFRVLVTLFSGAGSIDLFVGDQWLPTPGPLLSNFSSVTYAPVQIVDVPAASNSCTPAAPPANATANATCPFYFSVAPYNSGLLLYTIVVSNSSSAPIALADGQPQTNLVTAGGINYYNLSLVPGSSFHSLTVSTSPYYGEADVYVTLNDASGQWPSPTNSVYSASGNSGSNLIYMSYAEPRFSSRCPPGGATCNVALAVGYSQQDFLYTISATSSTGAATLVNGIAMSGFVTVGAYAYFNFTPSFAGNFSIYCTAVSGDPDLYVSATDPRPSQASHTWNSATEVDEYVPIATTDPNYAPPPAWYAIGVYGYSGNVSFTIMARMDGTNVTSQLTDGVPQAGAAPPHGFAYFKFQMPVRYPLGVPNPGIDIAALPTAGDCDLYVSNVTGVFPSPVCLFYGVGGICTVYGVDRSTYAWSSALQGSKNFISLPPSVVFPGETFTIGVFATSRDSPAPGQLPPPTLFSVIASTGFAVMDLPMGQQVPGSIIASSPAMPNRYKNYKITLTAWGFDLVVQGTPTSSGNINMFAAEGFLPTASNFNWSTRTSGFLSERYIYVPFTNLSSACQALLSAGAPCYLFLAVQGTGGSGVEVLYQLSAQISGSNVYPFLLSDGNPIATFVPAHAYEYFFGYVNVPPTRSIFVVVQNIVGSTSLYMNLGNSSKTFWVAGGPPPDIYTPNMGGYERVDIFPPSQWPPHVSSDGSFGTAQLGGGSAATPFANALAAARVVARMPSGAVVIEVPLRAETVPIVDSGREVGTVGRYSSVATRASAANLASDRSPNAPLVRKLREARHAEAAARARGDDMAPQLGLVPGAPLRADPPPQNRGLWCTGCVLFLTVAASVDSQILASFTAGAAYQTLQNDVPVESYAPRADFSYFAFAATDPLSDITISIQPIFGETDVYIAVQWPTAPDFMPGNFNNNWQIHPWAGSYATTINHTDTLFCKPGDGTLAGVPCVFLIAVYARNNETATFTLSASADASPLTPLFDGAPQPGTVLEGQLQYYSFQSAPANYPAPPAGLVWTNLFGAVAAYVTNQYVAGVSSPQMLPGPGSLACQWIGLNFSGVSFRAGDPCYSSLLSTYTIGILGASGYVSLVSQFVVTASVLGDPSRLMYGVPTTNIFVPKTANVLFTFEVLDMSRDIIVASTPTYGEVGLLVAPLDRVNGSVPGCSMACSGCQVVCANYTWFLPSFGSSPVLYINASDPCHVPAPASTGGPTTSVIVAASCNRYSFRPGRYYAALYGFATISETSLTVAQNGQAVTLADGQPQDMQTGFVTLCPGQRDNATANCNLGMRPSTVSKNNMMSIFTFRIPVSARAIDAYVIVDRLCNGNTTGLCGQPLHVFVVACAPTGIPAYNRLCNSDSAFPTAANSQLDFIVQDVQGSVRLNYNLCQNSAFNLGDCLFFVAVYPVCNPGAGAGPPGVGCPPSLFRATFVSDAGVERVPNDCLGAGNTCVLPEAGGVVGSTKRYLAYAGDAPTTVTLTAQACSGAVAMYYCDAFNGHCQPVSFPGPTNSDLPPVSSSPATMDAAAFSRVPIVGSLFYLGVRPIASPGTTMPTFQVIMQSGSGPLLVPSPTNPAVAAVRDASGTSVTVTFDFVYLKAPGQLTVPAPFADFYVYAFPGVSLPAFNLDTPCGNDDAWASQINGQLRVFTESTTAIIQGLQPAQSYTISVVAMCNSAKQCLPGNMMEQRTALMYTSIAPAGPPASPSPSPPPPSNGAGKAAGLSPAAAAGLSIAALLVIGGGAFFAARRMGYSFSLPSFGGSPAYKPSQPPSSAMFSSSADSTATYVAPSIQGTGETSYSAL